MVTNDKPFNTTGPVAKKKGEDPMMQTPTAPGPLPMNTPAQVGPQSNTTVGGVPVGRPGGFQRNPANGARAMSMMMDRYR